MTDDELRRYAGELLSTVAKLRSLAQQTGSIEARSGLLALAARFEEMARGVGDAPPADR